MGCRMPSPWGWRCVDEKCVKEDAAGVMGLLTLNTCKLTCGSAGMLWPRPAVASVGDQVSLFLPQNVTFRPTCQGEACILLFEAFDIFRANLEHYHPNYVDGSAPWMGPWNMTTKAHTLQLDVTVGSADVAISLNMDESYELAVTTNEDITSAIIIAPSYFGARHGMETLSQLIEYHESADALMVVTAVVSDAPAFPYRGLLLDTARNYLSVATMKRTLDAMAANKLNTLHWHITDTNSFPLILDSVPNMAYYGAYSPSQVYTPAQVRDLVSYARVRGIRLLPELDVPAHVGNGWQWTEKEGMGNLAVCINQVSVF